MAAKRTEENLSFQDRLKAWWETDTAKAVATIVAVLLIPASVIAWNYATTQGRDIRNQLSTDVSAPSVTEDELTEESSEDLNVNEPATETEQEDTQATAPTEPAPETPAIGGINEQGQEPATTTNTDTATNNDANQPETGGLGSVEKLPNTSSEVIYTTVKGDNVYEISLKVCGNDSYYLSNFHRDYLRVGETLRVNCN